MTLDITPKELRARLRADKEAIERLKKIDLHPHGSHLDSTNLPPEEFTKKTEKRRREIYQDLPEEERKLFF